MLMTPKSGTPGKTVHALARSLAAIKRQKQREQRSAEQQLEMLDTRPGHAASERIRLGYALLAIQQAQEPNETARRVHRARRRAQRKGSK
jgi:hypothetical protein